MTQQSVQIKGTREGLVIFLNTAQEFDELKDNLLRQLERAKDFFKGARFTFCPGKKSLPIEQTQELLRIVTQYGLVYEENINLTPRKAIAPEQNVNPEILSITVPATGALLTLPTDTEEALLLRHNLRSGQSVKTDKHLITMGDVHPGASVTAAGSIIVMGSLAGIAAAGAYGNKSAVIIAHKLAPIALSISRISAVIPQEPITNGKAMLKGNNIIYTSIRK